MIIRKKKIKNIEDEIFFEETFVKSDIDLSSGIFIDSEIFQDVTEILKKLENFYSLSFLEQKGFLKHSNEILDTIKITNISKLINLIYKEKINQKFINNNQKIFQVILEITPNICNFINSNSLINQKRKSILLLSPNQIKNKHQNNKTNKKDKLTANNLNTLLLKILNFIQTLLHNDIMALRETSNKILKKIFPTLNKFIKDRKIITILLSLIHEDENLMKQILGMNLLIDFCPYFSGYIIEGFVVSDIKNMIKDENIILRQSAYAVLVEIVKVSSKKFVYNNFRVIVKLMGRSKEDDVLKLFLVDFKFFVDKLPLDYVHTFLLPVYLKLQKSSYFRIVGYFLKSVHSTLLSFITKFKEADIKEMSSINILFDIYFNMHYFVRKLPFKIQKMVIFENYKNLDKIFLIFGKKTWGYLKKLIRSIDLWNCPKIKELVKLSLLNKIGNIVTLIGKNTVEKEFLPLIREKFLRLSCHTTSAVKIKTIGILSKILEIVDPKTRKNYADFYLSLYEPGVKWRVRYSIVKKLDDLLKIFEISDVLSFIVPLYFLMCKDDCSLLRKEAAKKFFIIIFHFKIKNPDFLFLVESKMIELSLSDKTCERLIFIDLCESLVFNNNNLLTQTMKEKLLKLSKDRIVNVRIKIVIFCKNLYLRRIQLGFARVLMDNFKWSKSRIVLTLKEDIKKIKDNNNLFLKNILVSANSYVTSEIIY